MPDIIKLFCFPYAGGSAAMFTQWKKYISPAIELVPVELAGRGRRLNEPLYPGMAEAIADCFDIVRTHLNPGDKYAFFGHSMGSMIIYYLAKEISDSGFPPPLHLFFSGRKAPHTRDAEDKKYHLMDDITFENELIKLGGTPPEFFEIPELMNILLPVLRSDFRLSESEPVMSDITPFDMDITVLLGKEEDMTADQGDGWKRHTRKVCSINYFPGGHFFLHDEIAALTDVINLTCSGLLKKNNSSSLCGAEHYMKP